MIGPGDCIIERSLVAAFSRGVEMEPITVVDKEREYEENFLKDGFEFVSLA